MKRDKLEMHKKMKELTDGVTKQKKEIKEKFDHVLKKHHGISPQALEELFPDDKELVNRLMNMKDSIPNNSNQETIMNKSDMDDTNQKDQNNINNEDLART